MKANLMPFLKRFRIFSNTSRLFLVVSLGIATHTPAALASGCDKLPGWESLHRALASVRHTDNGGYNIDVWGVVLNRDGAVCAVTFSGKAPGDQRSAGRLAAAAVAHTALLVSLPGRAVSSANLYSEVQPGGSLFGLGESEPLDPAVAYAGDPQTYGSKDDPLIGKVPGGFFATGGGLALYSPTEGYVGAIGVGSESSCADHNIAWKTRHALNLDYVSGGVSPDNDDNIMYLARGETPNALKHVLCGHREDTIKLPPVSRK
ncbi:hypothetical protein [Paraburkholderia humisilvae]|uniref:Heme-binding protein n=1 Tax=Paraburkholderia humisilvae TaxID=627669 RepID=A0A6J5F5A8_9BURK|nr:hypothetical protein [Paraburkholderia humisilvae]CAB3772505.1 hypothetical protein LMG29542_06882 [Paraburkholderia humisilvae]